MMRHRHKFRYSISSSGAGRRRFLINIKQEDTMKMKRKCVWRLPVNDLSADHSIFLLIMDALLLSHRPMQMHVIRSFIM